MKRTYEVTMYRTYANTVTVEAESRGEADDLAFSQFDVEAAEILKHTADVEDKQASLEEAVSIVLDLARGNVLDAQDTGDDETLEAEREAQEEAIFMVEDYFVRTFKE
jgi:hypothetical protein